MSPDRGRIRLRAEQTRRIARRSLLLGITRADLTRILNHSWRWLRWIMDQALGKGGSVTSISLAKGHLHSGSHDGVLMRSGRVPWRYVLPWLMVLMQSLVIVLLLLEPRGPQPCSLHPAPPPCDARMCAFHFQASMAAQRWHDDVQPSSSGGQTGPGLYDIAASFNTSLSSLPVRVPSAPMRLFYNRIPKCGSSTFMDIIGHSALANNFTFFRDHRYMTFWLDTPDLRQLVTDFDNIRRPMMFERHFHFVDFTSHGSEQPVYVNLLRDPLERLVSWYYFRRYQAGHVRSMSTNQRVRTFDECVLGNYSECVAPMGDHPEEGWFKIIPFFCGQDPVCRQPGEVALVRAISNIKKSYLVVGVIEEYDKFVTALEFMLPDYFRGATHFYKTQEHHLREKHRTTYKLPVSPEVTTIMQQKLRLEYQLYYFVRQRFRRLYDRITASVRS